MDHKDLLRELKFTLSDNVKFRWIGNEIRKWKKEWLRINLICKRNDWIDKINSKKPSFNYKNSSILQ